MIKSTWNDFVEDAKGGLMYLGSTYGKSLDDVSTVIEAKTHDITFDADRTYLRGSSVLQFTTEINTVSRLDKRGTVFTHEDCFIIQDDKTIIIYKRNN